MLNDEDSMRTDEPLPYDSPGTRDKRDTSADPDCHDKLGRELEAIIESVSDGIYITDGEGNTLRVNSAFTRITDIPADQVIGRNVRDLVTRGVYRKAVTPMVLKKREAVSIMETLANGKEALLTGSPVFDDNGRIYRVVTTLRDVEELRQLKSGLERSREQSNRYRRELSLLRKRSLRLDDVVVASEEMKRVMDLAVRLGEVDTTILITGESGVGKEIVTRMIHQSGGRPDRPFITANCGAIPEPLLESELFGYEGGAFTGARKGGKPGYFEVADGGTIFLDEVGEMSLGLQVKLLRAVQEKEIVRVGGRHPINVNVRIISATNRDLEEAVKNGRFRQDLYYRLSVVPIRVPPVREQPGCILPLINHFLDRLGRKFNRQLSLESQAIELLEAYPWPGNVRELENTMERMVVLSPDDALTVRDLPDSIRRYRNEAVDDTCPANGLPRLKGALEELEQRLIRKAYASCGSTRKAAAALGMSQPTLVRRMGRFGIRTK